ncbi:MAG TPA: hypothetical protein VF988_04885, partial [Verrucomicrobiae bacterium]
TNRLYLVGSDYALFASLLPHERIYKCPADLSRWPLWTSVMTLAPELRSYAMNSYLGTTPATLVSPLVLDSGYKIHLKSAQISADGPAERFVFMDVNPANICTPGFGVDMSGRRWIHYPSDLHGQCAVIAFADGHVEAHRWLDARTRVHLGTGAFIGHGTAVQNNADHAWITAHTTGKK